MSFRGHFIQWIIKGKVNNANWMNSFCWALDTDALDLPEGAISFTAENLQETVDPVWNDNGLILGLQSRFARLLPALGGNSVDSVRVIARSGTMLSPVQYEIVNPMAGTRPIAADRVDVGWTAMYMYASCNTYGQSGARFWVPVTDEQNKAQNTWDATILDETESAAYGVLNSINSQDHEIFFLNSGVPESNSSKNIIVVKREKVEVAPPLPPYKGIYKYNFPYFGAINAYTCAPFVAQAKVSHMDSRQ